jgi:hypothetical protein
MLGIMILVYLKGKATSMKIKPVPNFIIYIITSSYMVFKVTWYGYVLLRYH